MKYIRNIRCGDVTKLREIVAAEKTFNMRTRLITNNQLLTRNVSIFSQHWWRKHGKTHT